MPAFQLGLSKRAFLQQNKAAIEAVLDTVDARLETAYGGDRVATSLLDVWVITYCEAGIDGSGKVDPTFVHSEGEIGLYPLPSNIKWWNGPDAPAHNVQSPVEVNAFHYFLYLGHLKNRKVKTLGGMQLYRDLFRLDASGDSSVPNAKMLAAVVHGYFFDGNYSDHQVPLAHLIEGFSSGMLLEDIMRPTTYKHAGSSIILNRRRNIDAAIQDFGTDVPSS